jgi:hypothetical protein
MGNSSLVELLDGWSSELFYYVGRRPVAADRLVSAFECLAALETGFCVGSQGRLSRPLPLRSGRSPGHQSRICESPLGHERPFRGLAPAAGKPSTADISESANTVVSGDRRTSVPV